MAFRTSWPTEFSNLQSHNNNLDHHEQSREETILTITEKGENLELRASGEEPVSE